MYIYIYICNNVMYILNNGLFMPKFDITGVL